MKKQYLSLLIMIMGMSSVMLAKFYVPEDDDKFYKYIARHRLAIVHFNPYPAQYEDKKIERMKDAFFFLSKKDRYKDADLAFVGVNLQQIPELADDFNIDVPPMKLFVLGEMDEQDEELSVKERIRKAVRQAGNGEAAGNQKDEGKAASAKEKIEKLSEEEFQEKLQKAVVVMLFKDGQVVRTDGKIAKRVGFLTSDEIAGFIERHFGNEIDAAVARKEAQERQREQARVQAQQQAQQVQKTYYVYEPSRSYYSGYYPGYYNRWGYRPYYRRWGGWRGWGGWGGWGSGYWGRRGGFGLGFGFGW